MAELEVEAFPDFLRGKVTVDDAFDGLAQQRFPETGVALRPRPDRFLELGGISLW